MIPTRREYNPFVRETTDRCGNGKIYPDFEVETPYIVVFLDR